MSLTREPLETFLSRSTCTQKADCILRVRFETNGVNHVRDSKGEAVGQHLVGENVLMFTYQPLLRPSNIRVTDVKESSVGSVFVYEIKLQSDSIAAFVWLSFPDDRIRGSFDRNGFFAFEPEQVVRFSSFKKHGISLVRDQLMVQTLN